MDLYSCSKVENKMKKVLILGRGPSLDSFKSLDIDEVESVILMNNHEKTLQDQVSFDKLKDKNIYVCAISTKPASFPVFWTKLA